MVYKIELTLIDDCYKIWEIKMKIRTLYFYIILMVYLLTLLSFFQYT